MHCGDYLRTKKKTLFNENVIAPGNSHQTLGCIEMVNRDLQN